jgi:bla regulator protein BlaR1
MHRFANATILHSSPSPIRALLCALWLATASFAAASAQTQAPSLPKPFDVAAIKPNKAGSNNTSMGTSHGRLTATNLTVRTLILKAFRLTDVQLSGGPDWISTERFDISAKTADQSISDDDLALSLQPLLVDRFHLKFHRETRQEPVLSLVAGKTKPGLAPHIGTQEPSMRISNGGGKASLDAKNVSMAKFTSTLAGFTSHVVRDNTRLNGGFDFKLEWAQDHSEESTLSNIEESLGITGPSLYTALQEQLGLKLERATGPVEILVVDAIDRPTAN